MPKLSLSDASVEYRFVLKEIGATVSFMEFLLRHPE